MNMKTVNAKMKDSRTAGFIENLLNENGPTAAMIGGILLMGAAIYAAFKASNNVTKTQTAYDEAVEVINSTPGLTEEQKKAEIKYAKSTRNVGLLLDYKWVGVCAFGSGVCMYLCNKLNGAKIAGLTALAIGSQDKIKKMAENGKKLIGEEKFKEIENKTLEDIVLEKNFTENGQPAALNLDKRGGDMVMIPYNADMFQIHECELESALEEADKHFKQKGRACLSMSDLYTLLGLTYPDDCSELYWGPKNPFKAHLDTRTMFGMSIKTIEFDSLPTSAKEAGVPGAIH